MRKDLGCQKLETSPTMVELVEMFRREVDRRVGTGASFEVRQRVAAAYAAEVLAKAEEEDQAGRPTEVRHVPQDPESDDPEG